MPRTLLDLSNTEKIQDFGRRVPALEQAFAALTALSQQTNNRILEVYTAVSKLASSMEALTTKVGMHIEESQAGRRDLVALQMERAAEKGAAAVHAGIADKFVKPIILAVLLGLLGLAWHQAAK